jgi:hypothetical protein
MLLRFIETDGSFFKLSKALARDHTDLMDWSERVRFPNIGTKITIRIAVNNPTIFKDTLILIDCTVARLRIQGLSSKLINTVPCDEANT